MRVIKFRSWFKEEKEMIYSPAVTTHDLADKTMPAFWSRCEDYTTYVGDVVLMQFTGLLDKNGVEIYEGDIIQFTRRIDNNDSEPEVGIFESTFEMVETVAEVRTSPYLGVYLKHKGVSKFKKRGEYEVIGNIHQNPDLLTN